MQRIEQTIIDISRRTEKRERRTFYYRASPLLILKSTHTYYNDTHTYIIEHTESLHEFHQNQKKNEYACVTLEPQNYDCCLRREFTTRFLHRFIYPHTRLTLSHSNTIIYAHLHTTNRTRFLTFWQRVRVRKSSRRALGSSSR